MWKSISSLARFTKKQVDSVKKAISQYAGQVINLVPEPIRRTVNTVTGNLMTKINGIFENKKKLPPNAVEESSPQQELVTNKTEIKSTPNETGESSTTQEVVTNKTEIKLAENGGRVKVYKTTGNLSFDLTDKIMEKITPIIETRTKVIHAFSCVIYRRQGEIIEYSKTFKAPPGTFSSLDDIKEYIRQCEQKRLDLEDAETWSKAYLPATATYASKGVYEGRVRFTSVSTKIILSNEPLLGCGPLPKWLADKKCVYAIDKIDDNLCFWRCLVIHQRIMKGEKRPEEKTNRDALKLARDFYKRPNLKRENVWPTRLVDFANIAKQFKVNIRLFEPRGNEDKTAWRLVFGKNQFKKNLPCVDIGLFVYEDHDKKQAEEDNRYSRQGHCFFIKDIELLTKTWECVGCGQRFNRHDNYNRHVTGGTCGGGKTKLICPGEKLKRASEIEETVWLSNPVLGVYKKFNEDDKGEQYGGYLINEARVRLPKETAKSYVNWVKQVPVFGFNSGRYDINMIKEYFVKNITEISDVNVAKKENSYMFLSTPNFKFLDIKNYLAPGLSYDAWCRAYGCELQKLAFPYEWFDSFEKLNHIGPVKYEEFYSSLKGGITISQEEYQNFCDEFRKRGCETMKDWLKECNLADVKPFIEALEKTREQYYPDEIDLLKDAVSIPGISMNYVLNKALKMKKKSDPDLFAPGDPCKCKCKVDCKKVRCEKCKGIRDNCEICTKNEAYEMLTTGMIGGPSIVFCRHAEAGVSKIRSHIYSEKAKTCRSVQGLDANSLYLYCSGQEMPCGKEKVFHCGPEAKPEQSSEEKDKLIQNVLNDKLFGFFQVEIEVPEQLRKHFSEFSPLFILDEVPEEQIPQHMKDYQINTGRKKIKNNKKLLGVMKAEKILLYSPLLKWYLNHGLQVTKIHRYISYTSSRPFAWFPEEVSSARRAADNDKNKKQLGDTAKLKGNSFYGKMIENLEKHISTKFTTDEKLIDKIFRSPFFEDLEEISNGVFEVRQRKRQVTITRPYQCGIAVYQLAKLRMLEFYYDFLDKFCDRRDFELIQMDTDSFYMALSAEDFDDIIKPEMKELYKEEKKNWLVTDEYSKRVPGLFKLEFRGKRMIALTSKCYFADNGRDEGVKKFSCKGVSRRQNEMSWERYRKALFGSLDKARNIGFRKRDNHIVTYEQSKLGLSAYYDKRIVHEDGIHTSCL